MSKGKYVSATDKVRIKAMHAKQKPGGASAPDVTKQLELPVSPQTVSRFLKNEGASYSSFKATAPLTGVHKAARIRFAQHHLENHTDFSRWILSDEKRFSLDGPDGVFYAWHMPSQLQQLRSKRSFQGGSIMVWGAIRADHTVALTEVTVRMNSTVYQEVLSGHLLPYLEASGDENLIFQQDNAPCHASRSTVSWFQGQGVASTDWPSLSPDLNPTENIWGYLVKCLYGPRKPIIQSKEHLRPRIYAAWESMPAAAIRNCTESVPRRLSQVLLKQGAKTDY
ncbi:hypothetical protein FOL47_006690 [Perkinsus chesapeaki]|uniref:Transposable element Tc3 transposase n=1 Tax=Perkinsus chesapeaki TaxID=330153 RepID=A0A7J6LQD4_PERCH|nr:hypothetical protein FOL47_006690 [Perkinsus chesapeaki]